MSTVLLTGATGFVGRNIARELASRQVSLRCLVRRSSDLKPLAGLPLELTYGDATDEASLEAACRDVHTVIHLVAVIRERGRATYELINRLGTAHLVRAAQRAGVRRFIYMSNIGASPDPTYPFLRSKWQGEEEVKVSGIPHIVFRSSLMFGPEDEFTRKLAQLVRLTPIVPIIGSGRTRFQPIFVADTARCVALALGSEAYLGRTIDIGGPEHLTYEEMVDAIIAALGRRRLKLHLPIPIMRPLVWLMERVLPNPPVTSGQLRMLSVDNITSPDAVERTFGFKPVGFRQGLSYLRT
ncbi:MAG: complex I NDUFA9 subunit family protein [Chloroflexi bacterium]|nr:complex I NDUFA9 subunit family protein [Chloroflexota bacterium]